MRTRCLAFFCPLALIICLASIAPYAEAADIVYPGAKLRKDWKNRKALWPKALSGNTVTITSGSVESAFGAADLGSKTVKNNTLTLVSGTIKDGASGGTASNGTSIGNTFTIKGGRSIRYTGGGDSETGNVLKNKLDISGGFVDGFIAGGYVEGIGRVKENKVLVSGTAQIDGRWLVGGSSDGQSDVINNSVKISGGTVKISSRVAGAYSAEGLVQGNTVLITGGKTSATLGIYGGMSFSDSPVKSNKVTIKNGTVKGAIYGGYSQSGTVRNNKVVISGGTVAGKIYGGYQAGGNGGVTDNTITLSGSPNLVKATLYGGFKGRGGDMTSGNRLLVKGFSGSVRGLNNFGHLDFTLPKDVQKGSTILTVTGKKAAKISNSVVSIRGFSKGANALAKGSKITLVKKISGTPLAFNGKGIKRGAVEVYNFTRVKNSKNLVVKVASVKVNSKAKSVTKNRAETLDMITRSADRVADQTMAALRQNASLTSGLFMFCDASASLPGISWSSEGKVSSSLAGLGFSNQGQYGTLALGSFFESGWTDSHAEGQAGFDSASLRDKAQSSYGSGLLARFDHKSGLYAEGALRYGKAYSSFDGDELRDGFGNKAAYDSGSRYTSFHTGIGHIYSLNENFSVDTYSKLFVTSLKGNGADMLGDKLSMKDSESRRIRSGAKFSFSFDERLTAFAGLAHEYEADGKVRADIAGHKLGSDNTRGHSAMVQAGFSFKPMQDAPLSLYVDYKNYAGARKDTNASAGLMFEF